MIIGAGWKGATRMDNVKRWNLNGAPCNFSPLLSCTPGPPLPSSYGLISFPLGSSPFSALLSAALLRAHNNHPYYYAKPQYMLHSCMGPLGRLYYAIVGSLIRLKKDTYMQLDALLEIFNTPIILQRKYLGSFPLTVTVTTMG